MEPGISRIFRPVLVWPEGISQSLDDRHVEAILAHKLCHVRRRDTLTATIPMLVEAIKPLILNGRDERIRTSDPLVPKQMICRSGF